jgi:hypothetical protein
MLVVVAAVVVVECRRLPEVIAKTKTTCCALRKRMLMIRTPTAPKEMGVAVAVEEAVTVVGHQIGGGLHQLLPLAVVLLEVLLVAAVVLVAVVLFLGIRCCDAAILQLGRHREKETTTTRITTTMVG